MKTMNSLKQQDQSTEKVSNPKILRSTPKSSVITWEEFDKHYSRELLLMDCLDWLKDRPYDAKEILDHLEYCSSNEKTDAEPPQMDQVL